LSHFVVSCCVECRRNRLLLEAIGRYAKKQQVVKKAQSIARDDQHRRRARFGMIGR
jgi:hypothetical protein